jgi:parallel beta-helix repeat protein
MREALLIFLLVAAANFGGAQEAGNAIEFYVSPDGSDTWSGRQPEPDPEKDAGPFATLKRAQQAVRALKKSRPVRVNVRGGRYFLEEPLAFTPDDSGTAESPIAYTAYKEETPVISGGRQITGWKPVTINGKKLWAADIPEVRDGSWYFRQLWVNGQRRIRARYPNQGFVRIASVPDIRPDTPWNQGQSRFQYAAGDIRAWENLEDVDVVVLHFWIDEHLAVTAVDEDQRLVTFLQPSRFRLTESSISTPARYYVENALELLDQPGEWYLNRKTGVIYYWPLPQESLGEAEVIAPVLDRLLVLEGQPDQPVEYLRFQGLAFAHSEWWYPRGNPGDNQAASSVPGAIQADHAQNCVFERVSLSHVSNYGIHLQRGCRLNRIVACDLSDLGAGGVKIGERAIRDDAIDQTHTNEITDNRIHDGGMNFHQAVGVWIGQSYNNHLAHNLIRDFYYTGISAGWTWGYGRTLARDNVIEWNDVHDIGKAWLSDMGGIYTLGVQPGTVIRSNLFHDISAFDYGGWGIYLDEGSTNILAENNLVYRTTHGGFHQHYGRENVIRNNIFAFGRSAQIQRTRQEPHLSFTFERNLVYWTAGNLLAGNWDSNIALDYNLYWRTSGGEIRFGSLSWDQWRARGRDTHSVIADPLFADPDAGDFSLDPESPAQKLGFEPLDLSEVGPRKAGTGQ